MNLFVSTFINKIDKKGRVSLPSIFRSALPKDHKNEIILSKSLRNNFIDGLSVERVNEIAKRINNLDFFSDEHEDFTTSIFSEMLPTNLDKEGRFLIPEKLKSIYSNENYIKNLSRLIKKGIKIILVGMQESNYPISYIEQDKILKELLKIFLIYYFHKEGL